MAHYAPQRHTDAHLVFRAAGNDLNVAFGSTSDSRDLPLPRLLSGVKQTLNVRYSELAALMSGFGVKADSLAHLSECRLLAEAVEEAPTYRRCETMESGRHGF